MKSEGEITGAMERLGVGRAEAETAEYIGDGVYASFDGFHVWARTLDSEVRIAFEPSAFDSFMRYGQGKFA